MKKVIKTAVKASEMTPGQRGTVKFYNDVESFDVVMTEDGLLNIKTNKLTNMDWTVTIFEERPVEFIFPQSTPAVIPADPVLLRRELCKAAECADIPCEICAYANSTFYKIFEK